MRRWWMRPALHWSVIANLILLTVLVFALANPEADGTVYIDWRP